MKITDNFSGSPVVSRRGSEPLHKQWSGSDPEVNVRVDVTDSEDDRISGTTTPVCHFSNMSHMYVDVPERDPRLNEGKVTLKS